MATLDASAPIDRVEIIGDHPWAGHVGAFVPGSTPGAIEGLRLPGGAMMALIELENGQRCYATKQQLRIISRGQAFTHPGDLKS